MAPIRVFGVVASSVRGGGEEAFATLLRGLDRERFQVWVACDGRGPMIEEYRKCAVAVYPLDLSSPMRAGAVPHLWRLMRQTRCHLVHTQLWNADLLGGLAARLAGVPAVAGVQGAYFLPIGIGGFRLWRRVALSRVYRTIYAGFDRVVAASRYVMRDLVQRPGIRVAPGRIEVIHNGLDLDRLERQTDAARRRQADTPTPRRPRIVTIANFFPIKGHEWLVRAVPSVAARFPNVEFVLVGEGESRPAIEDLVRRLGVASQVRFTGSLDNPVDALLGCDVFVLPSVSEGLPIALLEAMALGIPVVASRVGGIPEIVTDGEDGVLVPAGNADALGAAIIQLLENPEGASRLAARGRDSVLRRFSAKTFVNRIEAVYLQIARSEPEGGTQH